MSSGGASGSQIMPPPQGPPYLPQTAQLGGLPTVDVDVPISAVLLLFFAVGAATNMIIFQINRRRDHKFIFSVLLFGFCMARIAALTMRIAWATRPTNVSIAIAANVLTVAGVVILFIVNLLFASRMVRAYHPTIGWHPACRWFFRLSAFSVLACLVMAIVTAVQSFFTLDPETRISDRDVQRFVSVWMAALAFIPLPTVIISSLAPRSSRVEKFGQGRFRTKLGLLVFTSMLLALGAGFRAGVQFDPRPITNPAWFHHKACYYCFNFVIELIVVYTYAVSRFDRRFHVPNGSSGPGHYAGGRQEKEAFAERVNAEVDVFGDGERGDEAAEEAGTRELPQRTKEWEARAREELEKETRAAEV